MAPAGEHGCVLAAGQQPVVDHRERIALHRVHDRVNLDRVHEVIGEEHQQAQAGEQQHQRAAHREAGEAGGPVAAGHAHRVKPRGAVGKGGDEGAQHDLVGPVAQEVAQQPGRELRGRQLQCHYRQPQQQRDDRHHRARDRDQQATGVIGSALERQRGMRPDGDLRQHRPGGQGGHHGERRHHPQRSPGVFGQCVTADHAQLLISRVPAQMAAIPGRTATPSSAGAGHSLA